MYLNMFEKIVLLFIRLADFSDTQECISLIKLDASLYASDCNIFPLSSASLAASSLCRFNSSARLLLSDSSLHRCSCLRFSSISRCLASSSFLAASCL